jgi:hypothetical protein
MEPGSQNVKTRLAVTDVSHFEDGRTVFAVVPEGNTPLIEAGPYELLSAERSLGVVQVEGEVLTTGRRSADRMRSVSTIQRAPVPSGRPASELALVPC